VLKTRFWVLNSAHGIFQGKAERPLLRRHPGLLHPDP
jgi:hypothetical protein